MSAALAILIDSYRELNARKLFWVTLLISGVVVLSYGSIGFDETGISMLFGLTHVDSEFITADSPWARALYLGIFSDFFVALWLAWIATILALISTTSIFPDFVSGGSIDLVLSKPISRTRLFLLKYLSSLLFIVMQVSIFCVGIFLCVGLRLGEWKWMVFAAIPIVTVFYSYLYSVNVLVGVISRSALAALLATLLFWFSLFSIQTAESALNETRTMFHVKTEELQSTIDRHEEKLRNLESDDSPEAENQRQSVQILLDNARKDATARQDSDAKLAKWHEPIRVAMFVLPKTQLTMELVSRSLRDPDGFSLMGIMTGEMTGSGTSPIIPDETQAEVVRRVQGERDAVSPWIIIGSSLAFEVVVLTIACLIFVRRDY